MCQNNLREGVFDAYAVDPTNPHNPTDRTSEGLLLPAVQDTGLLLPAVQCVIDFGDSAWDHSNEFRSGKWAQTDYSFDLI